MGHDNFYNDQLIIKASKYLSLILRHKPEIVGLELDNHGWALVKDVLKKCNYSIDLLNDVIRMNDKKRFEYNADKSKIRACQGHSIKVDLDLPPSIPPEILYHGTATKFIDFINKDGIIAKGRDFVHLSIDRDTANKVGSRHGKPAILLVESGRMYRDGLKFYLSTNGVWLTKEVPPKYFEINW